MSDKELKQRPRRTVQVQLAIDDENEKRVLDFVEGLAKEKQWKETFIRMVTLVQSFEEGTFREFKEQYPNLWHWLHDKIEEKVREDIVELFNSVQSIHSKNSNRRRVEADIDSSDIEQLLWTTQTSKTSNESISKIDKMKKLLDD